MLPNKSNLNNEAQSRRTTETRTVPETDISPATHQTTANHKKSGVVPSLHLFLGLIVNQNYSSEPDCTHAPGARENTKVQHGQINQLYYKV